MRSFEIRRRAALKMGLSALALGLVGRPVLAQTAEEFYAGNVVTLVISAAPGGASDFFARLFAPFFGKHIPGQPQVIVTNLAGASGMKAALQLQNGDPRDGSYIALLQRNNFYLPMISEENAAFDPRAVNWIGSLNKESYLLVAWEGTPAQTPEDIFTKPMSIGATSFANENRTFAAMMNEHFGTKFEIITGYEGSEAVSLAMEKGEVDGRLLTANSILAETESAWYKDGRLKVLMQVSPAPHSAFPGIPMIQDYAKDDETRALANWLINPLLAGRPFAVPGEVPEDRVAALRTAFDAAAADPEFLAEVAKLNSEVSPITGAEVEALIDSLYETPAPVVEKLKILLTPT